MSIGAPSKVVKMPEHQRSPAFAPVWTVQVRLPPAPFGMFGIAACADDEHCQCAQQSGKGGQAAQRSNRRHLVSPQRFALPTSLWCEVEGAYTQNPR